MKKSNAIDVSRVTRVEVIDQKGRSYVNFKQNNEVELELQDDGLTLKVFIKNAENIKKGETLIDLYNKMPIKSDKGLAHNYMTWYSNEFTPKRMEKLNFLEIGISRGTSLKLFGEWFVNSKVIGIDNQYYEEAKLIVSNLTNVEAVIKDAYSEETLDMYQDEYFDYIIEDGLHNIESQLNSVEMWWPKLKKGGKLIVEDVQDLDLDKDKFDNLARYLKVKYDIIDLRKELNYYKENKYDNVLLIFNK